MNFPDYWGTKKKCLHFKLDTDNDGISDFIDCKPFNKKRQAHILVNTSNSVYKLEYILGLDTFFIEKIKGKPNSMVPVGYRVEGEPTIFSKGRGRTVLSVEDGLTTSPLHNPEEVREFILQHRNYNRPPKVQDRYKIERI